MKILHQFCAISKSVFGLSSKTHSFQSLVVFVIQTPAGQMPHLTVSQIDILSEVMVMALVVVMVADMVMILVLLGS